MGGEAVEDALEVGEAGDWLSREVDSWAGTEVGAEEMEKEGEFVVKVHKVGSMAFKGKEKWNILAAASREMSERAGGSGKGWIRGRPRLRFFGLSAEASVRSGA